MGLRPEATGQESTLGPSKPLPRAHQAHTPVKQTVSAASESGFMPGQSVDRSTLSHAGGTSKSGRFRQVNLLV